MADAWTGLLPIVTGGGDGDGQGRGLARRRGTGGALPDRARLAGAGAQLALHWLRAQDKPVGHIRFDGVGVLLSREAPPIITHVPGIGR